MNLDKDQNSLFRCHTRTDRNGFIWINLDAKQTPEVAFEKHLMHVENQCADVNFEDYTFDTELKEELKFNWKSGSVASALDCFRKGFDTADVLYFPNASSTISTKLIAIHKMLPQSPDKTTKHYELYRHKECSDEDWKTISDAYAVAIKVDEATGKEPFVFQTVVHDAITEHYKQEKASGRQIWPSRPVAVGVMDQADEDEDICKGLACGTQKEVLAW